MREMEATIERLRADNAELLELLKKTLPLLAKDAGPTQHEPGICIVIRARIRQVIGAPTV